MTSYLTFRNPEADWDGGDGPLGGLSVVLQPGLSVRGWPAEAGSAALEGYVAIEDATVVERLRAAGARLAGTTRMAELGLGLAGDTTASALAEHGAALVADTLGEARHVAAAAGAYGLKPSYGLVSRRGLTGLVPSMEAIGIVAGDLDALAAVASAIAGPDERDPSMQHDAPPEFPAGEAAPLAVVGVVDRCLAAPEPAEADAFGTALEALERTGTRAVRVSIPDFAHFASVHRVVGSVEASSAAGKYDGVRYGHRAEGTENWNEMYLKSREESFGLLVKSYLFQGAYFQFRDYGAFENACRIRRRLVEQTAAALEGVDALVLPVGRPGDSPADVATLDELYAAFALTLPANVTGHPALSLAGRGLQLVGPLGSDARLLAFARALAGAGTS